MVFFMNEEINLKIRYTVDDYARAISFVQSRQFIFRHALKIAPLISLGFFVAAFGLNPMNIGQMPLRYIVINFFPVFAIFLLLVLPKYISNPIAKWNMKKQFESSPLLKESQTILFDEEGINGETYLSSGLTKWEAIIEAMETDKDFFFFLSNKMATFVPKRAFQNEFQMQQLRELAARRLGDIAKF